MASYEQELLIYLDKSNETWSYENALFRDHYQRIEAILKGEVVPPYEVEIQTSSRCNVRCGHCFGKEYLRLPDLITPENMSILVDKVNQFVEGGLSVENVKFCGSTGDPLLNEATIDGILMFKAAGKKVILFTNGLWMDKEYKGMHYYDVIAQADRLNLSLDADCEETFMRVKRVRGFDRIISSLKKLVERKKGLAIEVSYVISKKNYGGIVPAAKFLKEVGVDTLLYRVDFTDLEGVQSISDIIIKSLAVAKEQSDEGFKVFSVYDEDSIRKDKKAFNTLDRKCYTHHFWASIGSNLDLYACGHRTHGGVKSYGNLLTHSFRELWQGTYRQENVANLPDKDCTFCSPGSTRRNDLLTFLSQMPLNDVVSFHDKYYPEAETTNFIRA